MRIIMAGVSGKTGRQVAAALEGDPEFELVAAVGQRTEGEDLGALLCGKPDGRRVFGDVGAAAKAEGADVYVDFTHRAAAEANLLKVPALGMNAVVGTTGLTPTFVRSFERAVLQHRKSAAIIANFSLGAALLARLCRQAAETFPDLEIIELHSAHKKDKPSGTAAQLAKHLAEVAGGEIPIHSVRLPGLVAHQEVLFGGEGELFTLRHDVFDRSAYSRGVVTVLRSIGDKVGLFTSMDDLLAG